MGQNSSEVAQTATQDRSSDDRADALEMLRQAKACADPAQAKRIQDQVVVDHIGIARSLAGRYRNRGVDMDDLHQIAYLGLMKAVAGCDPDRCEAFLQYAVPTIMGELKRHFRDKTWTVRPTRRIQELHAAVVAARTDLVHLLGRDPSDEELAKVTESDVASVREAVDAGRFLRADSLDAALEAGNPLVNASEDNREQQEQIEISLTLSPGISALTDRERTILQLRFVDGYTQSEIGRELGLSQMHVSRLLRDILAKLRKGLEKVGMVAA